MLAIEVRLLTGRYVATAFDDRGRAEWPPHPARLFSALVATHYDGLEPSRAERDALMWLEALGPPEITAPEVVEREVVTVFVPVNDVSVIGSLDDENEAVKAATEDLERTRSKGGRAVATAERKLDKARERIVAATRQVQPGKEGKDGPSRAAKVLPEGRTRQPRTFPSVAASDGATEPLLVFRWPEVEPTPAQREVLDRLAERVVRLGHSSSLVAVRVTTEPTAPEASWIPLDDTASDAAEEERVLRVTMPGQIEALDAAHTTVADAPGRVLPAAFQRYVRPRAKPRALPRGSVFGDTDDAWIVLRRVGGPRLPSTRTVDVARTLRKALLAAFGPDAPEILSGHAAPSRPAERCHAAYVPLPNVANDRADGAILGVALILPEAMTREDRRAVLRALEAWEAGNDSGDEAAPLRVLLGRTGVLELARGLGERPLATLRRSSWCAPSRWWASATPVALDRHPGDLASKDPTKEAAAFVEAEGIIASACENIGLPQPARIVVTPAAPLVGAEKSRHFPPFESGKPPIRRHLVHAALTFEEAVRGPVLLGAGRYFGLGLFRPVREPDDG